MAKLVVVYGMDDELEEGLERLQRAGVGDKVRVIQRTPASDEEPGVERGEGGAPEPHRMDDAIIPPAAALGNNVPMGTPAPIAPFAVVGADTELERGNVVGYTQKEIEDITGADREESSHLLDVVTGGGSLLVVEGNADELDTAERALAGHTGQGAIRH